MRRMGSVILGGILIGVLLAGQWYHTKQYTSVLKQQEPSAVSEEAEHKTAFLTFDDGPSKLTKQYLEILDKHQAKATFFLIGQQIEGEMKEIVQREIDGGHEVGIHTYSHESGKIYQSADSYYKDVCRVRNLLQQEFGYEASFWRFPWGSANCYICSYKQDIVKRLQDEQMEYVDWNVSAEDSVGNPTSSSILENVRKDCFRVDNPVILMHDSGSNQVTLDTLEAVITMLEEKGYQFATISEREKTCHFGEYDE